MTYFHVSPCTSVCICVTVCAVDDGCEELRFTRLMDSHVCYDLIPHTSKLVVFDTKLTVTTVFSLRFNYLLKPIGPYFVDLFVLSQFHSQK